jgi:hypothetical protein
MKSFFIAFTYIYEWMSLPESICAHNIAGEIDEKKQIFTSSFFFLLFLYINNWAIIL